MSDRIDTDAIRRRKTALSRAQTVALCDGVDALRAAAVPDGHVRIDGKVYEATKLVTRGDGTGSFLSVLVPVEEPCHPLPDTPEAP